MLRISGVHRISGVEELANHVHNSQNKIHKITEIKSLFGNFFCILINNKIKLIQNILFKTSFKYFLFELNYYLYKLKKQFYIATFLHF